MGGGRVRGKMSKMKGCGAYEREWWRNNGLIFDRNKLKGLEFYFYFVFTLTIGILHSHEWGLVGIPNSFTREAALLRRASPECKVKVNDDQLRTLAYIPLRVKRAS